MIGSDSGKGVKYNPTIIHVKDLKKIEKYEAKFELNNPVNSFVNMKIYISKESLDDSSDLDDINVTNRLTTATFKGQEVVEYVYSPIKTQIENDVPIFERSHGNPKHLTISPQKYNISNLLKSREEMKQNTKTLKITKKNTQILKSPLLVINSNDNSIEGSDDSQQGIKKEKPHFLEYEKLEINENNFEESNESFCEVFLRVSMSETTPELIPGTEDMISTCGHEICSNFRSYKPEVNIKIPTNTKIDINSMIATLCFPKGVKLCFSHDESSLSSKNYFVNYNIQSNENLYLMNYYYYSKISLIEFKKNFKVDPIKDFLNIEHENEILEIYSNNPEMQKKISERIEKKLKMCEDFYFLDHIYIPKCISLVSQSPFSAQMEKCLETILRMNTDEQYSSDDINKLILHLIREIPIPLTNKKLVFYLPLNSYSFEIFGNLNNEKMITNFQQNIILEKFSIENIILIYNILLNEQKILFVCDDTNILSEIIETFISILYPIKWIHTLCSVLSIQTLKYLQIDDPFIFGIESTLLDLANVFLADEQNVYLIKINEDKVDLSINSKDKKNSKNYNIPKLPNEVDRFLQISLKELKEKDNFVLDEKNSLNNQLKLVFMKSNIILFGDYRKHILSENSIKLFNIKSFLNTRPEVDQKFFEKFCETLNFINFIQFEAKEEFPFFNKLLIKYIQNRKRNSLNNNSLENKSDWMALASSLIQGTNQNNPFYQTDFFVIPPYFIQDKQLKKNIERIDDILREKFESYLYQEPLVIVEKEKDYQFSSILMISNKRYIIPQFKKYNSLKEIKFLNDIGNNIQSNSTLNNVDIKNFSDIMKSKTPLSNNKQNLDFSNVLENYLNDIIKLTKESSPIQLFIIKKLLKYRDFRNSASTLIFQEKFVNHKSVCLTEKSLKDLTKIVFQILSDTTNDDYEIVRRITKSLFFYYYKIPGTSIKSIFLYQEIIKKIGIFNVWVDKNFWRKWLEIDLEEEKNIYSNHDNFLFNLLISLSNTMHELLLEFKFIEETINFLAVDNFNDKLFIQDLKLLLAKQFKRKKEKSC